MIDSVADILKSLKKSRFRTRFRLSGREIAAIREKGMETIAEHGRDFIRDRLSLAEPKNDGRQTPMKGHPIFIAQHATATCCRGCLARWHQIEKGRPLRAEECEYILQVLLAWIAGQMPEDPDTDGPDLSGSGSSLFPE